MIRALVVLWVPALLITACHSRSEDASLQECAPTTDTLPPTASVQGMEGTYRLKLVATSGAKKGQAVEGSLELQNNDAGARYRTRLDGTPDSTTVHPLFGTTDIDLAAVDAVMVGSTTSSDPESPGVLVIERHAQPGKPPLSSITIRLGSEANQQGLLRFDGSYTALHVRRVTPKSIAGNWASGVTLEKAAGYFCAVRE